VPRIFDNIEQDFVSDLRKSLRGLARLSVGENRACTCSISESTRADFRVDYFRLRGWGLIADRVDKYQKGPGYG
jgi:hypothetical protein